ncbi:serine protease [Saccharopolyspora sp. K220]|uniref:S1 family peptidase n=1 Tax=Saccharopolyspora soli TaxID=2926618 RepID=UPI001F5825BC|nr:serine protease [Saccharopolyspora soli]MCI2422260.1 serine protease [Saccharopolyspora soli]
MPRGSLGRSILAFAAATLASLALAAPTAGAAAAPLIIGGTDATETYSFMASMQSTSDGEHHCGATLIDKQWLVTAAHCVAGQQPSNIQYRIGSTAYSSGGELVKPDKFVAHPKSKQKQSGDSKSKQQQQPNEDVATGYDVALVHLSQPVEAQPIKIAATSPQPGTELRLLGWGQTCEKKDCGKPPQTLQELDTKTVDPSKCTSSDSPFDQARELCIDNQDGKASACYGDSGGPALVREGSGFALVGATSRGQAENCPDKPGIYSDLVAHTDWINETMSSGGSSEPSDEPSDGSSGPSDGSSGPAGGSPGGRPGMPSFPPGTLPKW